MPIKKYKSFEAASKDLWIYEPDENYYQKLKEIFEFWSKLSDNKREKGITKIKEFPLPNIGENSGK